MKHLKAVMIAVMIPLVAASLAGCASTIEESIPYSKTLGGGVQRTDERVLSRAKLDEILSRGGGLNDIRLVEIFRRGGDNSIPQYRVFDVRKGGVFDYIGLQNADILVAANDRVLFNTEGFRIFVTQYLKQMNQSSVNIVRDDVPILLSYTIQP